MLTGVRVVGSLGSMSTDGPRSSSWGVVIPCLPEQPPTTSRVRASVTTGAKSPLTPSSRTTRGVVAGSPESRKSSAASTWQHSACPSPEGWTPLLYDITLDEPDDNRVFERTRPIFEAFYKFFGDEARK